jgi:hypothetical protein
MLNSSGENEPEQASVKQAADWDIETDPIFTGEIALGFLEPLCWNLLPRASRQAVSLSLARVLKSSDYLKIIEF